MRPESATSKYRSILSIDGGGLRGIIPTMVLLKLEKVIKQYILEHQTDPEFASQLNGSMNSIDDFDVDLTDYFDIISGTSVGSWIASYIASRGKGCDALMTDPDVAKWKESQGPDYELRVGGVELIRSVFRTKGSIVMGPQKSGNVFKSALRSIGGVIGADVLVDFLGDAKHADAGLKATLNTVFSETTMEDVERMLYITAFDLKRNVAMAFFSDETSSGFKGNILRVRLGKGSNKNEKALQNIIFPRADIELQENVNYYLRDICLASSSAPTFFPPAKIRQVKDDGSELWAADGGVIANNPTLLALTVAPMKGVLECNVEDLAIFSVGCGITTNLINSIPDETGGKWWLADAGLINIIMDGTSEMIQSVMDFWFNSNLKHVTSENQYCRIQEEYVPDEQNLKDDKKYEVLTRMDVPEDVPMLESIGSNLAEYSDEKIKQFVSNFIFAEAYGKKSDRAKNS